ncbi:lipoprotein [Orbaceae bacterium ac157xtp]
MKKIVVLTCIALALAGCSNSDILSGDVYTADRALQVQQVSYGTVVSVRPVVIQANASNGSSNNLLGSLGGAILGGFIGNTIGGGAGNKLAVAGGALGGSIVGSAIEDQASKANAVELEIQKESGGNIIIVQKASPSQFHVGQSVRLVTNGKQVNASPRNVE